MYSIGLLNSNGFGGEKSTGGAEVPSLDRLYSLLLDPDVSDLDELPAGLPLDDLLSFFDAFELSAFFLDSSDSFPVVSFSEFFDPALA